MENKIIISYYVYKYICMPLHIAIIKSSKEEEKKKLEKLVPIGSFNLCIVIR